MPNYHDSLEICARQFYNDKFNLYHNWEHILFVLASYKKIFNKDPSETEKAAILFHDCIYVPGSPPGINETLSAITASKVIRFSDIKSINLELLEKIILATRVQNYLDPSFFDEDCNRVMDADIASLAEPYEFFLQNNANIIFENHGPIRFEHEIDICSFASAEFLAKISSRPFIYRTHEARDLLETKARENIRKFRANPNDIRPFLIFSSDFQGLRQ